MTKVQSGASCVSRTWITICETTGEHKKRCHVDSAHLDFRRIHGRDRAWVKPKMSSLSVSLWSSQTPHLHPQPALILIKRVVHGKELLAAKGRWSTLMKWARHFKSSVPADVVHGDKPETSPRLTAV